MGTPAGKTRGCHLPEEAISTNCLHNNQRIVLKKIYEHVQKYSLGHPRIPNSDHPSLANQPGEVLHTNRKMEGPAPIVRPALWTAASLGQPEEVLRLLRGGADIEEKGGRYESTPLLEALGNGHEEVALVLLGHGADV
jgi:hypothetical protein